MPTDDVRAKVFISCGQREDGNERGIAERIAEKLHGMGFDPYIATQQQSLRGLRENIFDELETSEYFVFVDFERERLGDGEEHRGSLFSNQELAVASYLDMPVIALREDTVKEMDGLAGALQLNAEPFSNRRLLPDVVANKVAELEWEPEWSQTLRLHRNPEQFSDALRMPENRHARFFHIDVANDHRRQAARNTYGFLRRCVDLATGESIAIPLVELKWAGYVRPNTLIFPGETRKLDALWVFHDQPDGIKFNVFTDATNYIPQLPPAGDFRLTYCVASDNFPAVDRSFDLHVASDLNAIRFAEASD
jgi:hypothetical protein